MTWSVHEFVWFARQLPWVVGLAVIVAALSWGHWVAMVTGQGHGKVWMQPQYGAAFSFGMLGVAVGIALNSFYTWEPYVAGGLAVYFLVQTVRLTWVYMHQRGAT